MMETRNAIITGTMLGYEDHGVLSAFVFLDYGGYSQGFGGYTLDTTSPDKMAPRIGHAACADFIAGVLRVTGAGKWEDIKGKHVRVRADYGKVHAIGHILKDDWFYPAIMFGKYKD